MDEDGVMWLTIHDTLQRSMGRWVNSDRLRQATDDITEALGGSKGWGGDLPPRTGPDAPLVNAVQRLLEFRPEHSYSDEYAAYVSTTEWRDADDPAEQSDALNDRPAWAAKREGKPVYQEVPSKRRAGIMLRKRLVPDTGPVPLLSQAAYYPILGKEDGRTLNAYIREVRRLAGLDNEEE